LLPGDGACNGVGEQQDPYFLAASFSERVRDFAGRRSSVRFRRIRHRAVERAKVLALQVFK
jgi:hypothetical protein